ncbi:MAG: family 78 glycoside hydrolase catalytic domain [Thermoguttaceae bacterium]
MTCTSRFAAFTLLLLTGLLTETVYAAAPSLTPVALLCENRTDPLGVDVVAPSLGWSLTATDPDARSLTQTAYQIVVASSLEKLNANNNDLWDSGTVASDATCAIAYCGKPLRSSQDVFWKVRVWDQNKTPSAWSQPARWTMGIVTPHDWKGEWITAPQTLKLRPKTLGFHAAETRDPNAIKWVQVDLGEPRTIDQIKLVPIKHAGAEAFGFPIRFRVEVSNDETFATSTVIADQTASDFTNPGANAVTFSPANQTARYVRVTATRLYQTPAGAACFALRQLAVISGDKNVAIDAPVSSFDSVEQYGWGMRGLTDGCLDSLDGQAARCDSLLVRREFNVRAGLRRAIVHTSGLGHFVMTVSGQAITEDLLTPGWTDYRKTVLYNTYDITPHLREGQNVAGILLGNGMYRVELLEGRYNKFVGSFGPLKVIAQLELEYADGTREIVATDASWQVADGPILYSDVFGGEDYDARKLPRGWDTPAFKPTGDWQNAIITSSPGGTLRGISVSNPPIRAFETLTPANVRTLRDNVTLYDLGQNVSLIPRLRVRGEAGASVRIVPAELINADGSANQGSGGGPSFWDYILAGDNNSNDKTETYFSPFFYRGARYLQVEVKAAPGSSAVPKVESIEGIVVHADSPVVGNFECSSDLFNRTWTLIRWAQRSNMVSVMTDCPHREKLGWLEEDHLNGPALRYNFDMVPMMTKIENDMADAQTADGMVPSIAPEYVRFGGDNDRNPFRNSPEWGSSIILVPWQQYIFAGDRALLERYYEPMVRYIDYLETKAVDSILDFGLGDWFDIGPGAPGESQLTPKSLTATATFYQDVVAMTAFARLLGKTDDVSRFEKRAREIHAAFQAKFFDAATGTYATNSQTANAMPLALGMVPPEHEASVLAAIVKDIESRNNSLTSGDVGYRYLLMALAKYGRSDVIFAMNNHSERPGYGMQLAKGATSLTEAWDANPGPSQNHFMLGQLNEWFFHDLAGIAPDESHPGFASVVLKPAVVGDIEWVRADYRSVRGLIRSHWKRSGDKFVWEIELPPNTVGTVVLPISSLDAISESGRQLASARGVTGVAIVPTTDAAYITLKIGSGRYTFEKTLAL